MSIGSLFVFSGPSGSGKTTLAKKVVDSFPNMNFVISFTTRLQREGEIDGKDYNFVELPEFRRMVENGEFVEWAEVFGNYYGTPLKEVNRILNDGKDVLLEIDVAGARQIKEKFSDSIHVFIIAPDMKELEQRLVRRKTDSSEEIKTRLNVADTEMAERENYDYIIINKDLESSFVELKKIIELKKNSK